MLIILQEASISKDRTIFLPVFILKAIARIAQLSREHPEIDHTKGVSVRMSIHSIEVLASEAERIRSAQSSLISVPRFSDFYCIYQTCKFQLSEIDDTRQSRAIILNSIIEGAIKDVSTDYMQDLSPDQLIKIKQDFEDNKLFIASQQNPGLSRKNGVDYVSQLEKFPNLNDLVTRTVNKIKGEHLTLVGLAAGLEIDVRMIELINNMDGEFTASVTELVLEGLRWTNPPLLDKVGNKYSARPE